MCLQTTGELSPEFRLPYGSLASLTEKTPRLCSPSWFSVCFRLVSEACPGISTIPLLNKPGFWFLLIFDGVPLYMGVRGGAVS